MVFITTFVVAFAVMQVMMKTDPQTVCERLLNVDDDIIYSSVLNASGSIVGEAIKESISSHSRLTIMLLPVPFSNKSVVLATAIGSDIIAIVEKTKVLCDSPLLFPNEVLTSNIG
jgi:hypothetical protein